MSTPTHGHTKSGQAVHAKVHDHMPSDTAYARFNKKVAMTLTKYVGTMTTFWVFCVISLLSLPAVLSGFHVFSGVFPALLIKASIIALVAWVAQTFIQLVLLPALMVGQNLQNEANDARTAKSFEDLSEAKADIEKALRLLDVQTEGGLGTILHEIEHLSVQIKPREIKKSPPRKVPNA